MTSEDLNGLICFTNCLLPQEDGSMANKDLWVDVRRGVILDAQRTFFMRKQRPAQVVDLQGNILSPGLIDIQINGAYGFDFSIFDGDEEAYREGMKTVAEKIVETGVTALVPTTITQEQSLYPRILSLLKPYSSPNSASLLGWHAEGPFLASAKRGAHAPPFLKDAPEGFASVEALYGPGNLAYKEDWLMEGSEAGVRIITAAPEVQGIMESVTELNKRGIVFSIGHSVATSTIATEAVYRGARLITHLFNAMPQLHHRDPSIIGLLGASPGLPSPFEPIASKVLESRHLHGPTGANTPSTPPSKGQLPDGGAEALDEGVTPPQTPVTALKASKSTKQVIPHLKLDGSSSNEQFVRPFYELIVDGIHSHPNSVRLAYSAYPEGCILITDAMKILDPNLKDGVHEWRDGQKFVKDGDKLYLEGTDTLAGSVVTLDKCVRNFAKFTGCSLGEAIKCATVNPAKCLGIENKKGTLRPGADADFVVMDRNGNVLNTWVAGRMVWEQPRRT